MQTSLVRLAVMVVLGTTLAAGGCDDGPVCGDDLCELARGESPESCAADCHFTCGDGICEHPRGEDATRCAQDCGWVHVAVGHRHTCAALADGTAWCTGWSQHGAIGTGTVDKQNELDQTQLLSQVTGLSADFDSSCALEADGRAYCWGYDWGLPEEDDRIVTSPAPVGQLTDVIAVADGGYHSCLLRGDGTVWCRGMNTSGQLPSLALNAQAQDPVQVEPLADATSIATSIAAGDLHGCGVMDDSTVWCWGGNHRGQLGLGYHDGPEDCDAGGYCSTAPLPVPGLTGARAVSARGANTCVRSDDGTVWCWGSHNLGEIGNGEPSSPIHCPGENVILPNSQCTPTPTQVVGLTDVVALSTGGRVACAIRGDATLWCWGANDMGQLGIGTAEGPQLCGDTPCSPAPVQVTDLEGITAVSAGPHHVCALRGDATLWCWGQNYGALGTGDYDGPQSCGLTACSTQPIQVRLHPR